MSHTTETKVKDYWWMPIATSFPTGSAYWVKTERNKIGTRHRVSILIRSCGTLVLEYSYKDVHKAFEIHRHAAQAIKGWPVHDCHAVGRVRGYLAWKDLGYEISKLLDQTAGRIIRFVCRSRKRG